MICTFSYEIHDQSYIWYVHCSIYTCSYVLTCTLFTCTGCLELEVNQVALNSVNISRCFMVTVPNDNKRCDGTKSFSIQLTRIGSSNTDNTITLQGGSINITCKIIISELYEQYASMGRSIIIVFILYTHMQYKIVLHLIME